MLPNPWRRAQVKRGFVTGAAVAEAAALAHNRRERFQGACPCGLY